MGDARQRAGSYRAGADEGGGNDVAWPCLHSHGTYEMGVPIPDAVPATAPGPAAA